MDQKKRKLKKSLKGKKGQKKRVRENILVCCHSPTDTGPRPELKGEFTFGGEKKKENIEISGKMRC
jgi:hypothetical protein